MTMQKMTRFFGWVADGDRLPSPTLDEVFVGLDATGHPVNVSVDRDGVAHTHVEARLCVSYEEVADVHTG